MANPLSSALGLGNLANNIASGTKGLATAFGLANPEPNFKQYPDLGITSKFQREHWYSPPSQGFYAFTVETVGKNTISPFPPFVDNVKSLFDGSFFSPGDKFGEFRLPITPQEITQTEDFAVSIRPTQGGTVVNHSGNKYKTLSVSGTTGVQPYRGLLGVFKDTGLAIGKPDELQYRSGYEVFQHFRNWMRSYHQLKAAPGSETLRMVFRNYKDWEFLYVEPIKFTMKRDASKPLLYNYSIQFRVLGNITLNKPIYEQVISDVKTIAAASVNAYALIKSNKDISNAITGNILDLQESYNNLKMAIKAANRTPLTLGEFAPIDANKLSFLETTSVLALIGNAMGKSLSDPKTAEQNGTKASSSDPATTASNLVAIGSNPTLISPASAQAQLQKLLDTEPFLMTGISVDSLPINLQLDLSQKQITNALISRSQVEAIQTRAREVSDKLAEGVGLSDLTYNKIFGLTTTIATINQNPVTDAQFEMLYALNQSIGSIDGILSSDEMFDTNAQTYKQNNSTNGADTLGQGIFSFPDPNTGIREGYLSAGITLEDIALRELGDSSRWTEIAELNNLKAPYIISYADTLSPSYQVESLNYYDPTQIRDLQITFIYRVPPTPTPTGAWTGRGNQLAEYLGGPFTDHRNWRFIYPDTGMLIQVTDTQEYYKFDGSTWDFQFQDNYLLDGVLKPGDKIRIPSNATPPPPLNVQGPRDNQFTNGLSAAEKSLAVDLKVNDSMDLDLTPSGDLNVSFGTDNAAQAIVLKLLYNKGSLKKFPSIGTNLTPGKKVPDIATLRTDLTTSLLQDSRIKDVTKINIIQDNGAVTLSFEVIFQDIQQPIPITIPV